MGDKDGALVAQLVDQGIQRDLLEDALELDGVMLAWRIKLRRRKLGQRALREIGLPIDLSHLDVLMAIHSPIARCETDEVMVSTIASRLYIDPSRASRMVTELLRMGLVERSVSQRDARRSVVTLSEAGEAAVAAVRKFKYIVLSDFLSGWTREEIDTFKPLFQRFSHSTEVEDEIEDPAIQAYTDRVRTELQAKLPGAGGASGAEA